MHMMSAASEPEPCPPLPPHLSLPPTSTRGTQEALRKVWKQEPVSVTLTVPSHLPGLLRVCSLCLAYPSPHPGTWLTLTELLHFS